MCPVREWIAGVLLSIYGKAGARSVLSLAGSFPTPYLCRSVWYTQPCAKRCGSLTSLLFQVNTIDLLGPKHFTQMINYTLMAWLQILLWKYTMTYRSTFLLSLLLASTLLATAQHEVDADVASQTPSAAPLAKVMHPNPLTSPQLRMGIPLVIRPLRNPPPQLQLARQPPAALGTCG
jgi:hypothetical protein